MSIPPVVMVGYSRSATLKQSLHHLSLCEGVGEREIFLFLDAPYKAEHQRDCDLMFETARMAKAHGLGNLTIVRRDHNYGVPGNLIDAVTTTLDKFGRIIFFEDDVLVSKTILRYMDAALECYKDDRSIFCINAFHHPFLKVPRSHKEDVFMSLRNTAWGFGIWKDRWNAVDFKISDWEGETTSPYKQDLNRAGCDIAGMLDSQKAGRLHTWDVQCSYHMVKEHMFAVEPRYSLTKNIGFGTNGGVHCKSAPRELLKMPFYNFLPRLPKDIAFDPKMEDCFRYALIDPRMSHRILRRIRRELLKFAGDNSSPVDI